MNFAAILEKFRDSWPVIKKVILVGWTIYQSWQRRKNQKAVEKLIAEAALKNSTQDLNKKISEDL